MTVWTMIFAAMALAAAPFAFADIVRSSTETTAFLLTALFAGLALLTCAWTATQRLRRPHRVRRDP